MFSESKVPESKSEGYDKYIWNGGRKEELWGSYFMCLLFPKKKAMESGLAHSNSTFSSQSLSLSFLVNPHVAFSFNGGGGGSGGGFRRFILY